MVLVLIKAPQVVEVCSQMAQTPIIIQEATRLSMAA